ncbi:hypothetical protein [Methanosarcina spelaei]|uniref:hypothetical protein n=1 Tax=Methanosarcina spelaei TaxID=1036679 RepID=UPI0014822056|nr:hypothetical protein [Methanosarcina spelaei]
MLSVRKTTRGQNYMYELGRKEQVGTYLRNRNIRDELFDEQFMSNSKESRM